MLESRSIKKTGGKMGQPKVDKGLCIGCGTCVSMCPDCFELGDDMKSNVIGYKDGCCDLGEVAESCPVAAISISE